MVLKWLAGLLSAFFLIQVAGCGGSSSSSSSPAPNNLPEYRLGNINLSATDLVLDGYRVIVDGDVTIDTAGSLTISNGTVEFDQAYSQQFRLEVRGSASLTIDNVSMEMQPEWMNWAYYDNAAVTQNNFIHGPGLWQEVHGSNNIVLTDSSVGFTFMQSSAAMLSSINADFVQIEMALPSSGTPYNFTFPNGQSNANWNSPVSLPYSISLTNAQIRSIDFDIFDGVDVVVSNTSDVRLGWVLGLGPSNYASGTDTITGLKSKLYTDQTFSAGSGAGASSLRLVNSSLADWWPTVFTNHTLNLDDCDMADPRAWNDSTVNVTNSTMTMFGAYNNGNVAISNSTITNSLIALNNSSIVLSSVVFSGTTTADSTAQIIRDGVVIAP